MKFNLILIFLFLSSITLILAVCDQEHIEDCDQEYFENEEEIEKMADEFLFSAVSSEEIENKDSLMNEIDKRIADSENYPNFLEIFNEDTEESLNARNSWWEVNGYKSEGAKIESFDGKVIKTIGEDSTTFNINHHVGAFVTETGCLKSKDFDSCGSTIQKIADQQFKITGGLLDLKENSQIAYLELEKDAELEYNNKKYFSETGPVEVYNIGGKTIVQGKEIIEMDLKSNQVNSEFSGEVTFYNNHITLGSETEYVSYKNGEISKQIFTFKPLSYYKDQQGFCSEGSNCIEEFEGTMKVSATEENTLRIDVKDDSIKTLNMEKITDDSLVAFNDKNDYGFYFAKDVPKFHGNFFKFKTNVYSYFTDENNKLHKFDVEDSIITQCSYPCREFGIKSIVEPKIMDFTINREAKIKEINKKYGSKGQYKGQLRPDYARYAVFNGDPRIYKATIDASEKVYYKSDIPISPQTIYMSMIAEGGDKFITYNGVNPEERKIIIDGFESLGFDMAYDDIPKLKKEGYLPENFVDGENYFTEVITPKGTVCDKVYKGTVLDDGRVLCDFTHENEQKKRVRSVGFLDFENALQAKGAELAWRKNKFLEDTKKFGIDASSLSEDEKNFWTYVYYNYGIYGGKEMFNSYNKKGYLRDENYLWQRPDSSYPQVHQNANLRMINLKMVESFFTLED